MKRLNKLVKNILIIRLFNRIVIYCKMFYKKSMKAFKETELYKENEITFFLCLSVQDFKNCAKFSHFFLQEKLIIFIYFLLFKKILHTLQQIFTKDSLFNIIRIFSDNQLFSIYFSEICWIS